MTVALTPDGRCVVSGFYDAVVRIRDLKRLEALWTLEGHAKDRTLSAVALTGDGERAVSASTNNTIKVWNLKNGTELRTVTGHTQWVDAMALMPDGHRIVSASRGKLANQAWPQ